MILELDDNYFMSRAIEEAEKAYVLGEVPVGAVVVIENTIIARAHNLTERLNDVTAHAEMQAITAAANYLGGKYLSQCTLYVTLEPCMMCAGGLYWSQLKRLVYAASDYKRGFGALNINLHPKTNITKGVLENKSSHLLKKFFFERR